ncbi:MAG: hypothetical protein IKM46_06160 [Clostridia bacterium]|nr:hypothetical protein [Clostridia bacterium]
MKKILSILLLSVMLWSSVIPAAAALPDNQVTPLWEQINTITNRISFNDTTGYVDCSIQGDSGTTVVANIRIFKQTASGGWSIIKTNSASSTTRTLTFGTDFTAVSGTYYKAVLTVFVAKDDNVETVTKTTYKTCP